MNEPGGGRPTSRSSRNAIPIEIKVAAISKIQSGRRPDTVSQEMEVPVGLINKWWLQRDDISTQFENYSKVQDYQERLLQKSIAKDSCDNDCDEKESKNARGKKKDPEYEEKVSIVKGGVSSTGKGKKKKGESPFKRRKRIELPTKSMAEKSNVAKNASPKAPQRRKSITNESQKQAPAGRRSSSTRELVANLFPSGVSVKPPKNAAKVRSLDQEERAAKRVRVSSPAAVPRVTDRRRSSASAEVVSPPPASASSVVSLTPEDVSSDLGKIKNEIASPNKDPSASSLQSSSIPINTNMDVHTIGGVLNKPRDQSSNFSPLASSVTSQHILTSGRRPSEENVTTFQKDIMKELNISVALSGSSHSTQPGAPPPVDDSLDSPPASSIHSVPVPLTNHTISIKKEINAEQPVRQDQNFNQFSQHLFTAAPSSGETQSYPLVPTAAESDPNIFNNPYSQSPFPTASTNLSDANTNNTDNGNQFNYNRVNIKKELTQEYIEESPPGPSGMSQDTSFANRYYSSIGATPPSNGLSPSLFHQTSSAVNVKRERISPEPESAASSLPDHEAFTKYGLSPSSSSSLHSTQTFSPQPPASQSPSPLPQHTQVRGRVRPVMRGRGGQPIIRGARPQVARTMRTASPMMRGQLSVRGLRPAAVRGVRPLARGQRRPGLRPQGGQPRVLRPPGVRPGPGQFIRGGRGAPGARPAMGHRPAASRPAPIPSSLQRISGLSVTKQAPVELPRDLRLPSGISLSHPRGIQNQPPEARQPHHQPPMQSQSYEAPKKKVTLELSQKQIDALKSLGML